MQEERNFWVEYEGGGSSSFRREDRGGGVERGFGSAPDHSPGLLPSVEIKYSQYAASRAKYTQEVSKLSVAAPGINSRMFLARFFLLF